MRLYGKEQLVLASECLQSVLDRHEYTKIHYHETLDLFDKFISDQFQDASLLDVLSCKDEGEKTNFQEFILKVGAHVTACIQSLHAAVDILAHAIYYSLALNKGQKNLRDDKINSGLVISFLENNKELVEIHKLLKNLSEEKNFFHVAALANRSKHRSVVVPVFYEDQTDSTAERYAIKFPAFKHKGTEYPQIAIKDLIEGEYDRCALLVIEIGNELNKVLCAR